MKHTLHINNCNIIFESIPTYGVRVYAEGNGEDLEFLDALLSNCPAIAPYFADSSLRYSHSVIPASYIPAVVTFLKTFFS